MIKICTMDGCENAEIAKGLCQKHYQQARKSAYIGAAPRVLRHTDGLPQRAGLRAQITIRSLLSSYGRTVKKMPYTSSYDLLVDDWRCEIKDAKPRVDGAGGKKWFFNIHRHGELKEDCDVYIFRLEDVPGFKKSVHLLLPAPIGLKSMAFTLRSLIETAAPLVDNFKAFARGQWPK